MDKLPNRKQLRIKEYDYSQSGCYFITMCTQDRQRIFEMSVVGNDRRVVPSNALQNKLVEKCFIELQNKYNVKIEDYIIMPDHIHFILSIDSERHAGRSLPELMQWFKTMTTNDYIRGVKDNKLKPFSGKLWQKSYFDHVIRNENDYKECDEYILNNPLKWQLDKNGEFYE